ncbi:alginate lyase family protein [Syntrophus aciditrophicus]|uniref:Hypothetical cytosolic protein n=1 Tax=Syntrophus aciditrophicus (strain SB) TaxID=56780 RepID=Q2LWM4_SYNAS|nr:alginate lyase family protein [Syntrophus aciditrophicus]ABC78483.1 hypothetical cytosolic protein [Syntrophus aciditrophicus SB]
MIRDGFGDNDIIIGDIDLFRRSLSKPPRVICFRVLQYLKLKWMAKTKAWQRFSETAQQNNTATNICIDPLLVVSNRPILSNIQQNELKSLAHNVRASKFTLFSHPVPELTSCDFAVDWRFGKKWQPQYYKQYNFYEQKSEPYDVKFPWELSRFHYLVPVLAWHWYSGEDSEALCWVNKFLSRWRDENPIANSVNWYAMEASMRIVNLTLMLDFVTLIAHDAPSDLSDEIQKLKRLLIIMLKEHGFFVWHNREFTDIRGNHFTANIVALLLAAAVLGQRGYRRERWMRYSIRWLDKEIFLQFLPDGVNFEKSCGYHKLVLELFLIAAITRERLGIPFNKEASARLVEAARFSDALIRPDNLAANFGDNDDAVALPFNFHNPHSHGAVVELARSFFNENIGSVAFREEEKLTPLFLLGRCRATPAAPISHELFYFVNGGYVIVRDQDKGFFLMVDVGEVGMGGRGGHGHNDLLAFELYIGGEPVVLDPGCSGYTSDLDKKTLYRSTASHATIELFGEEIARFAGHWLISNDAQPIDVSVTEDGEKIIICAGHNGYSRIASGSKVRRKFVINPSRQEIFICDEIHVPTDDAKIRWHFPIGNQNCVRQSANELLLGIKNSIQITSDLPLSLKESLFSCGYGQEQTGRSICADGRLSSGDFCCNFKFYRIQ